MSFSITNNSANAVITLIESLSSSYGTFTVTSGSFPLFSGQTVSGTNTEINNGKGSPEGSILLFLQQGNAQIEFYVNGNLISANDYSSGMIELKGPILQSGDTIGINVDEADLPSPSPTPSVTPTMTVTPTNTPTNTPSVTPSATPAYKIGQNTAFYYAADDSTTISGITGNLFVNGSQLTKRSVVSNKQVDFTGGTLSITLGATLSTLEFSASPVGAYYLADDGISGVYNRQIMSGFTRTVSGATTETYTGVTRYLTGTTVLPYTENTTITVNKNTKLITIPGASYSAGYFLVLPTP
jgi:hypothetical protein